MRKLRAPSPAFVVAMVALFVALGGTSYAATKLVASKASTPTTLASGKSESGNFGNGGGDASGDWIGVGITYPRALKAAIISSHVIEVTGTSASHCPGAGHAAKGYLCIYNSIASGVDPLTDIYAKTSDNLGKVGVVLYWSVSSDNASPYVGGSWTVTAS
jgi:hypothetical protein